MSRKFGGLRLTGMTTLQDLSREKTVLVTTYRKDGTPVSTPVNLAVEGDKAYFRTYDKAYKALRLKRNPKIAIAPSTYMGKATGEPIDGVARLLEDKDPRIPRIRKSVSRQHPVLQGILVPFFHRMKGFKTQYYEVTPSI